MTASGVSRRAGKHEKRQQRERREGRKEERGTAKEEKCSPGGALTPATPQNTAAASPIAAATEAAATTAMPERSRRRVKLPAGVAGKAGEAPPTCTTRRGAFGSMWTARRWAGSRRLASAHPCSDRRPGRTPSTAATTFTVTSTAGARTATRSLARAGSRSRRRAAWAATWRKPRRRASPPPPPRSFRKPGRPTRGTRSWPASRSRGARRGHGQHRRGILRFRSRLLRRLFLLRLLLLHTRTCDRRCCLRGPPLRQSEPWRMVGERRFLRTDDLRCSTCPLKAGACLFSRDPNRALGPSSPAAAVRGVSGAPP
ncbi:unnamed protein product [Scytosiphon promiscuus]